MNNDIVIRKATKPFICNICGRYIKPGERYFDKVILNYANKFVGHERYHDECPGSDPRKQLAEAIIDAAGMLPCSYKNNKYYASNIIFDHGYMCVQILDWTDHKPGDLVLVDTFLNQYKWRF